MKKGCFAGIGCSGIIIIILFALAIIDFISDLDISFDGFTESDQDYSFKVDSLDNQAVIKSDFNLKFTSSSLGRKNYKISFHLLEKEVKAALAYLDEVANLSERELNINQTYKNDQIYYTKLIWHEIYKRIYWQAFDKLDNIVKGFNEIFSKEKLSDRDKVYFIISFVQNIEYKRPGGKLDILPPLGTLAAKFGDCDTKALLLYILLEKAGVDCVMFWSFQYKHAMLGAALNSGGKYKSHKGKKYFFIETTYPGWNIGDIDPEMDDLNLWYVDDLDSDKMKIDYKYDSYENDTDQFDKDGDYNKNETEDSGKHDKASPSDN
ncbi:MAG: hypothetical protein RBR74_11035 [Ignavibacteriaceae bacterium]|jgi:hypothetical protein|nr:hypothetical protein [Ignavibacteriaceae bacterium]